MYPLSEDRTVAGEIDTRWGEVDEEASEIKTDVSVPTPSVVNGNPEVFGVEYTAEVNGARVAEAEKGDLRFGPRRTDVSLAAEMEHRTVRDWWPEHIEGGESSRMRIKPRLRVDLPLSDLGVRVPSRRKTIETDALAFLNNADRRERQVLGRTVLAVDDVEADWGEPSDGETPVHVTAEVENPTRFPVVFSDVVCKVRMNGVDVGSGATLEGFSLEAGERDEVEMEVRIDESCLPEWWKKHVENDEETLIDASVYGAVDVLGRRFKIPLLTYEGSMETNVLT